MALKIQILGDCDVGKIDSFDFVPGTDKTLKFQVYDTEDGCHINIPTSATKTIILPASPSNLTINNASITLEDPIKGIVSANLSDTQTDDMISGDIKFIFVDGADTKIALGNFLIKRLTTTL